MAFNRDDRLDTPEENFNSKQLVRLFGINLNTEFPLKARLRTTTKAVERSFELKQHVMRKQTL